MDPSRLREANTQDSLCPIIGYAKTVAEGYKMEVMFAICAGLDVHKKSFVACVLVSNSQSGVQRHIKTFQTTLAGLEALAQRLLGVTHVAMESTGVYWKPVFNVLAPEFDVWIVNARDLQQVPGRKTDVKDAEWIAQLMRHGC